MIDKGAAISQRQRRFRACHWGNVLSSIRGGCNGPRHFEHVTKRYGGNPVPAVMDLNRVPDVKGRALEAYLGKTVTLGVRPEHLVERARLDQTMPPDATIPVTVDIVETLGNELFVYLASGSVLLTARMPPEAKLERG